MPVGRNPGPGAEDGDERYAVVRCSSIHGSAGQANRVIRM